MRACVQADRCDTTESVTNQAREAPMGRTKCSPPAGVEEGGRRSRLFHRQADRQPAARAALARRRDECAVGCHSATGALAGAQQRPEREQSQPCGNGSAGTRVHIWWEALGT